MHNKFNIPNMTDEDIENHKILSVIEGTTYQTAEEVERGIETLKFGVSIGGGSGGYLWLIDGDETINELLLDANVSHHSQLKGKACWSIRSGNTCYFVGLWKKN